MSTARSSTSSSAAALFLLVLLAARSGRIALAAAVGRDRRRGDPRQLTARRASARARGVPRLAPARPRTAAGRDPRRRNARGDRPWVVRNRVQVGCFAITTDAHALWKANNINTYKTLADGQVDRRRAPTPRRSRPDTRIRNRDLRQDRPGASNQRVRPDAALRARDDQVLAPSPGREGEARGAGDAHALAARSRRAPRAARRQAR